MCQCFPKPYETFGGDIHAKVGLSNYATKADLKNTQVLIHQNLLNRLI